MRLKTTLLSFFLIACFQQIYAQSCNADFETRNGLAVVELDTKTNGGWVKRSESGSSGGQALYYNGANAFNNPPGGSVLTYRVKVNSPGVYRVIIRSKIGIIAHGPEPATSEHNDLWLKIEGSEFYGQRQGKKIYPKGSGKTPNPAGASGNGYLKVYTYQLGWNWKTATNDGPGHDIYVRFGSTGVYDVKIGGRSNGFFVDKLAMYKEGSVSASQAQNASTTSCSGGTTPPSGNNAPTVTITNPDNGDQFNEGSNITVRLNSNDSDGNITKHEIFVNNNRVSNQGGNYSPYVLNNVNPGNYAIRATVTDNDGAKSSNSVNITVGENTPPPSGNNAPTVSITSPSNGQNFDAGSKVTIGLSANDSDGNVVKHEIFVNGNKVDTDGVSYTPHIINNIAKGNYAIKATVTDNGGKTASTTVNITVDGATTPPPPPPSSNAAPTVSFTNLSNGDQVTPGSTVSVGVAASDSDGSVVKYQVFVDGKLVDTDGSNYTPHPIKNITSGDHLIKVTVTDNKGATGSSTVSITAGSGTPPPSGSVISFALINASSNVSIGALGDGATISSSKTQGINIKVNAPSGTKRVGIELYRNGTLIKVGFENVAPYAVFGDLNGNYYGANLANGSYRLIAAAYSSVTGNSVIARKVIQFSVGSASGKSAFLFPNPVLTSGKVSVRLPEGSSGKYKYNVTNSLGVQVEQGTFEAEPSQRDVQLSLPNIGRQVQGVYYMTLSSNGSRETIPLIRE